MFLSIKINQYLFHGFSEQDDTLEIYDPNDASRGWMLELNCNKKGFSWKIHTVNLDQNGIPNLEL